MAVTALPTVKAHLRVDADVTEQDSLIGLYTDAAEEHVALWCNRSFGLEFPKSVTAAVLLLVTDLFENRSAQDFGQLMANRTLRALLSPHRDMSGQFGSSYPRQSVIGLEPDGLIAGDDFTRQWTWRDEFGDPIPLTGYTAAFEVLRGEAVVLSVAPALATTAPWTINLALTSEQTSSLQATLLPNGQSYRAEDSHWYRLRLTSPAGFVTTIDRKLLQVTR